MTSKFIITIEEDFEIAKKILNKWQFIMYKQAAKGVGKMLYNACNKYKSETIGDKTIFEEEGEDKIIEQAKKNFENFMFSDESELKKEKYKQYRSVVNDRWLLKVKRKVGNFAGNVKNKALKAALMGTDVMSFFSKIGLIVTWKIEKNRKI